MLFGETNFTAHNDNDNENLSLKPKNIHVKYFALLFKISDNHHPFLFRQEERYLVFLRLSIVSLTFSFLKSINKSFMIRK